MAGGKINADEKANEKTKATVDEPAAECGQLANRQGNGGGAVHSASVQRKDKGYSEGVDGVKYIYTAEFEFAEGIYAAKEYIDAWLRQAVDELGESRIEVSENE